MKSLLYAGALLLAGCAQSPSSWSTENWQPAIDPDAVQVMVVGTYHMAGSNSDLINVETDSVLTDRRQSELRDLANALSEFEPTMVVVERVTDAPDYIDLNYAEFDAQELTENENERAQIGYRLARQMGLSNVYGIDEQPADDEPDYFPFGKLMAHAETTGQAEKLTGLIGAAQTMVGQFTEETADDHIATKLLKINTGEMSSPEFYYKLSAFDQGEAQPAAELQAYWFMRNAKIWSKLMDVAEPGDRIVIVYGAGHKFWLEHFADQTPGYIRIDPSPFLQLAAVD